MAVWTGRPGPLTFPQAIPMADYRRKLFLETQFPKLAVLLAALVLYSSAASPWFALRGVPTSMPRTLEPARTAAAVSAEAALAEAEAMPANLGASADVADDPALSMRYLAQGQASAGPLVGAARTNALIAIAFIDGYVIEPGARFSFDDVARTWDFHEDPSYFWSFGTSRYGLINMRGGGVCWVSTALWRAALYAGLPTEWRQSHMGLVQSLGIGTDATNTLALRNDSSVPVTVRAWLDDEDVNVALLAGERINRKGNVRGPQRLGPGSYVLYQDVTWADGKVTSTPFYSGYYW